MTELPEAIRRLRDATNAHDLDALVSCFHEDYRLEMPLHPARAFTGTEQVRRNWTQIFASVPDLEVDVIRAAGGTGGTRDAEEAWSEWEMRGTRVDGVAHLMRGVFITGIRDGRIAWARFYLEPVDHDGTDMDTAVRSLLSDTRR